MANFIRNTQVKAMTSIWMAKQKARELAGRTKEALANREGQGTLDVAITVLISIVLGALIDNYITPLLAMEHHYPAHQGYVRFRGLMFGGTGGALCPAALFIKEVFYGVQSGDQTDADRP